MSNCTYTPMYCNNNNMIVARANDNRCNPYYKIMGQCPPCQYVSRCSNNRVLNIKNNNDPNYNFCAGDPSVYMTPVPQVCNSACNVSNCSFSRCDNSIGKMQYYDKDGNIINNIPLPTCYMGCVNGKQTIIADKNYKSTFKCTPVPTKK